MTPGHHLFRLLQSGHHPHPYAGTAPDGKAFDWWDALPDWRRQEYESAAAALVEDAKRGDVG